jgi:hypothetical protein
MSDIESQKIIVHVSLAGADLHSVTFCMTFSDFQTTAPMVMVGPKTLKSNECMNACN